MARFIAKFIESKKVFENESDVLKWEIDNIGTNDPFT